MRNTIVRAFIRVNKKAVKHFGHEKIVLDQRIIHYQANNPGVIAFYQRIYNNVFEIDSEKCNWFITERAINEIQKNLDAR